MRRCATVGASFVAFLFGHPKAFLRVQLKDRLFFCCCLALREQTMEKKGQIVSKERVREHGEVFTAEREVKAMVDLVNDMATKVDCGEGTFLEPACGDGNFLIEILRRKCAALKANKKPNAKDAERYAFRLAWALSSLYGIDILPDNVLKCRERLSQYVLAEFDAVVKGKDKSARKELEEACEVITSINIVEGNALKYLTNDGKPIVFVKWRASDDNSRGTFSFGVTPYYFDTMAGEAKKGDLFTVRDDLPRSPQYPFYEIGKIREFMKGIEV